jgi:hypothetical protein
LIEQEQSDDEVKQIFKCGSDQRDDKSERGKHPKLIKNAEPRNQYEN